MADIHDIPPEILAASFELGINTWGIGFLSRLCEVCKNWNEIINSSPRLWGIISIQSSRSSVSVLEMQIMKAKSAPLSVSISPRLPRHEIEEHWSLLSEEVDHWAVASISTQFATTIRSSWADLIRQNLEVLTLTQCGGDADTFLAEVEDNHKHPPKLRSFTANRLSRSWTLPFLSPSIRYFCLRRGDPINRFHNIVDTWEYLYRIPGVVTVDLHDLLHCDPNEQLSSRAIQLPKLETIRLTNVLYPSSILCAISAPCVRTLVVDRTRWYKNYLPKWELGNVNEAALPLLPFFWQWSQAGFIPTHLHTLRLVDCLERGDIPSLIRWLAHLPNLVRLLLKDEEISLAAARKTVDGEECNLFKALALPRSSEDGSYSWLCPSLTVLQIESGEQDIEALIPIAQARGGIAPTFPPDVNPPRRLRVIEAFLHESETQENVEMLESLVDEVHWTSGRRSRTDFL
ncbi:hypothetical protein GALMADRAFT_253870 [Galerina marginata CBS 339.88]|uniref:Uncharacterized protein n=1 Tax=Galerina marginata (strain CBS 339.88) TaxID=685588 RepID=A0A067SKX4_GALM3|nr:hypothetical protein GALMADRAFT_253870 [Galerina marginata CBS 339.88]